MNSTAETAVSFDLVSRKIRINRLVRDLLNGMRVDVVINALIAPLLELTRIIGDIRDGITDRLPGGSIERMPSAIWAAIREKHPEAAAFPLGPVVQRTVLRVVGASITPFLKEATSGRDGKKHLQELREKFTDQLCSTQILFKYLCVFIYEAAIMNMRGSGKDPKKDFGYLYHWTKAWSDRSLKEERKLRLAVWEQSVEAAKRILSELKKTRKNKEKLTTTASLVRIIAKVLESGPLCSPPAWRLEGYPPPFTIMGSAPTNEMLQKKHCIDEQAITIALHEPRANIEVDLSQLEEKIGGKLHSLLQDFLEIAATVYMADIYLPRSRWFAREMSFLIPVRHPEIWEKHVRSLRLPLEFLSGNPFRFEFTRLKGPRSKERIFKLNKKGKEVVALFSGGLDSFVGAASEIDKGKQLWMVSQYASQTLGNIQCNLVRELLRLKLIAFLKKRGAARKQKAPETELLLKYLEDNNGLKKLLRVSNKTLVEHAKKTAKEREYKQLDSKALLGLRVKLKAQYEMIVKSEMIKHVPIQVAASKKGEVEPRWLLGRPPHEELVQYTRSFLFLSIASCLAISRGIGEILVHENGLVALNPTFSEARFNTRTAHPIFLDYFKKLIAAVFGVRIKITNPFANKTKSEVLRNLGESWHDLIAKTNSCWAYARVKAFAKMAQVGNFKGLHCGRCLPCVWRRAAIGSNKLEKLDDKYLIDSVTPEKQFLSRTHLTLMLDLWRFCRNVVAMTDDELLDFCPDLWEGDGKLKDRISMLKKHAKDEILPLFARKEIKARLTMKL
jgi:7-cyano-7-deazaguanine synthase in queuosine biosynthesis